MKLPNPERLARRLSERLAIQIIASEGKADEGPYIEFRPAELHPNEGFAVRTVIGWRSILASLVIGPYAAELLRAMEYASAEQKAAFSSMATVLTGKGGVIRMLVNGSLLDTRAIEKWPQYWQKLELSVKKTPVLPDESKPDELEDMLLFWGGGLYGMVLSLLPVEELEIESSVEIQGLPEGAKLRVEVNKYERSRVNRALCLAAHGTHCAVCGVTFEDNYGEIGRDFIHVHHITPVSKLGANYLIDPVNDLIPVCPNCHAMLHRTEPPLSVNELKSRLRRE